MNSRHLIDRFAAVRERGEPLVLVTVYDTLGSTYSKAGARMLITAGGESQGLVSGGCLEGDLAERARQVLAADAAMTVTYDLRDEADELFGLGIGCNGLISVLLQPLTPANGYEPMASIAAALCGEGMAGIASVIEPGEAEAVARGATVVTGPGLQSVPGGSAQRTPLLRERADAARRDGVSGLVDGEAGLKVLFAPLVPIPRVLILGAGLDAVPLVNVLAEIGWRVTVADHRPAYLARAGFARAEHACEVTAAELGACLNLDAYDAIVVMSHHLQTDREYLRQLAGTRTPYLGLLGPPARRRRLLDELGGSVGKLATRLRGPVGIDIGADSAETIALSIAAEMQQVLATGVLAEFRRRA